MKPIIALSTGDPSGVGPEISIKAALEQDLRAESLIVLTGAKDVLQKALDLYATEATLQIFDPGTNYSELDDKTILYTDFDGEIKLEKELSIGTANADSGQATYKTISLTAQAVVDKTFNAIVTAPANKESINLAGIPFQGHTELVAHISGTDNFAMMQSDGPLRVIFVTAHIPINQVPQAVTKEKIMRTTELLHNAILAEGIEKPRIAIAGVNPHAGEGGYMGREEIDTVIPAMVALRKEGINTEGPFPADTLFIENIRTQYDGIVSMYHDQGHIPFKMLAFDRGVNSTMGLPIVRTSVDHGTAFNIAWQGKADIGSLKAAIKLASQRATYRFKL